MEDKTSKRQCRCSSDESELALVSSNCIQHSTSPVLSDHYKRWSPKSQTKSTQWTSMDNLQMFHRGGPQTTEMIAVYYIKGWEGGWWVMRMSWIGTWVSCKSYGIRGGEYAGFGWVLGLQFSPPSHQGGVNEIPGLSAHVITHCLLSFSSSRASASMCLEAAILWEETSENHLSTTHPFGVSGVVTKQASMSGDGEGNPRQHSWSAPTEHNLPSLVITWSLHSCSNSSPTPQEILSARIPGYRSYVSWCLQISPLIFNQTSPFQKKVQQWPTPANFQQGLDTKLPFVSLVIGVTVSKGDKRYSWVTLNQSHTS